MVPCRRSLAYTQVPTAIAGLHLQRFNSAGYAFFLAFDKHGGPPLVTTVTSTAWRHLYVQLSTVFTPIVRLLRALPLKRGAPWLAFRGASSDEGEEGVQMHSSTHYAALPPTSNTVETQLSSALPCPHSQPFNADSFTWEAYRHRVTCVEH